jgi:hypothetical protein
MTAANRQQSVNSIAERRSCRMMFLTIRPLQAAYQPIKRVGNHQKAMVHLRFAENHAHTRQHLFRLAPLGHR